MKEMSHNKWMQKAGIKGIQEQTWLGLKGDPLEIVQETPVTNGIWTIQNKS